MECFPCDYVFLGVAMADAPRQGKYKAIAVCWVLGLGTLFAWNSIVTIADYYYNIFPEYHPSRVLTSVYQPFALATLAIFSYKEAEINTRRRILVGYTLFFIGTLMLIIVDLVTSGAGGNGYFISICAIVGGFGVAGAHVEGGVVGELSFMCPEFIQSFFAGLGAAGAFTSALRLVTKAAFEKHDKGLRKGAMLFLGVSAFIELLCVLSYAIYFPRLPIVKYYRSKAASEGSKTVSADLAAAGIQEQASDIEVKNDSNQPDRLRNKQLYMQNIDYSLDLFLIYVLTSAIFPGFLFEDTGEHQLGSCGNIQFVGLDIKIHTCCAIPKDRIQKGSHDCNPSSFFIRSCILLNRKIWRPGMDHAHLSPRINKWLSQCLWTVAPRGYMGPEQNALGNILVLCLLSGIFVGVCLNWFWLIGKDTHQKVQLVKKQFGTGQLKV